MFSSIIISCSETGDIDLPGSGVTLFVGPNNSGKSLILREIELCSNVHPTPSDLKIVKDYDIVWPTREQIDNTVESMKYFSDSTVPLGHVIIGHIDVNGNNQSSQINLENLYEIAKHKVNKNWIMTQFLSWGVIRLDGRSRFDLTNDRQGGDLLGPPQNMLNHLFRNDISREKVREIVKDAFGVYFTIDPTNLGQLRIRLSETPPLSDEQSLNEDAREFHSNSTHIKDASDGIQAFTGIVSAVCSGEYHTILLDEPEAFLHPPLAKKLGKSLATLASERAGTLMAATHSADFLMGCVQGSRDVRIVRLEYRNGKSRARMIDPSGLESFFKKPLIRSTNVISGLFHDGIVVCESDNDRAFYSEIYNRIVAVSPNSPSVLFVNAQNKQTIRDIVGPMRAFGVPTVAIPDLDLLKDGGSTWTGWLRAANVPDALHNGLGQQRSAINAVFGKQGVDMSSVGIEGLDASNKAAAEDLIDNLESYGIFPVRIGSLECWLKNLSVAGKKTDWTVGMLERLGSDPSDAEYVHPNNGDVWDFMSRIVRWISEPSRKGMQ